MARNVIGLPQFVSAARVGDVESWNEIKTKHATQYTTASPATEQAIQQHLQRWSSARATFDDDSSGSTVGRLTRRSPMHVSCSEKKQRHVKPNTASSFTLTNDVLQLPAPPGSQHPRLPKASYAASARTWNGATNRECLLALQAIQSRPLFRRERRSASPP